MFDDDTIIRLQNDIIRHCVTLGNRVAILDPPPNKNPDEASRWRYRVAPVSNDPAMPAPSYAAAYYPWLCVPDLLGLQGLLRMVPPCGHIAGIYADSDRQYGVHKPPANEELERVEDLAFPVDAATHGALNDRGINVIRSYPGRGLRVAGARTLSTAAGWRFVNVRRLMLFIEQSINVATQWVVFEPNNPALWKEMDRVVRGFLDDLWRRGMLDGASAADAYQVRCDAATNPPEETDLGRLICLVGVQPPLPAEFVVVRIGKTEGGTRILETMG